MISRWAPVLPVYPIHCMAVEIASDRGTYRGEKGRLAKSGEESKALELVLDRVFKLGKAQLDSGLVQSVVQFGEGVSRSDVDARNWFCRNDQPAYRSRRLLRCVQDTLFEQPGVGEEQGRVPAKEDQSGYLARVGIACDIVVALDAFSAAQHCKVRTPAIPQKLDDGDDDRQAYTRNCTKHRDAHQADD